MDKNIQNLITKDNLSYCIICAWRISCQKKFNFYQNEAVNCIDFTRDLISTSQNIFPYEQHKK